MKERVLSNHLVGYKAMRAAGEAKEYYSPVASLNEEWLACSVFALFLWKNVLDGSLYKTG